MNTERSNGRALAAVFQGHGRPFELRDFPVPKPGVSEVLVDITCTTICGSDIHTWHGRRNEPTPCVLGHEITGRIVAFGPRAPRRDLRGLLLAEGDRVTWTLAASCGHCFYCGEGLPQKCESLFKYGHSAIVPGREFSGGFAECCLLTAGTGILRLPDDLIDEIAAPANCAVATVAAAFRRTESVEGSTVIVIGCGVLGLTACAMAAAGGAAEVIGCDLSSARENMARAFGANRFCGPDEVRELARDYSAGRGADLVLEFSGASAAVVTAIDALRTGGTALVAGTTMPDQPVPLDPNDLVRRMLTIKGLHNYAPEDLVVAVDFLCTAGTRYPYASLNGGSFALEQINEAFISASERSGLRVAVFP